MAWMSHKLKDCFKLKSGDGLTAKKMIEGDYPVYGGNSQAGTHNQFNLSGDNVIVGRVGALCGNARHITDEIWLTDNAFKIINKKFHFDNSFLTYLLNYKNLRSLARQAAQPVISNSSLGELELEFPLDVDEQKRIVTILDQVFSDIEQARAKTEQNLKNARELFESCLNKRLLNICSQAPVKTLSCITELIVDCEHKTAPTQEEGFPSIRTPNIGKGELILDNVKRVSKETYGLWTKRAVPEFGDLILAREAPAGNVGVIPEGQQVCLGQRTVLIRPMKDVVDSTYIAFLLLHPIMQNRLLSHSTGATVQHVNMKDIRQLGISKLPDIGKQQEDAKVLLKTKAQVSQLVKVYLTKLNALEDLKKSILQKAFSGELTRTDAQSKSAAKSKGAAA